MSVSRDYPAATVLAWCGRAHADCRLKIPLPIARHVSRLFPVAPLPRTLPDIPAPKRNSFSRLWPAQMSSHSRFTFARPPQQELPEAPALLDLAEHR